MGRRHCGACPLLSLPIFEGMKARVSYKPFCIWLGEPPVRWSGFWYLEQRELFLCSAYGAASRPLGRRKPDRLAEELLREVLAAKLAQLEAGRGSTNRLV